MEIRALAALEKIALDIQFYNPDVCVRVCLPARRQTGVP